MNNKRLGNEFEKEMCKKLNDAGYWVHFISPDVTGAQPFDIIAVKDNVPFAFDCKTAVKRWFPISRLEINQIMAFDKWIARGNGTPMIAVKYKDGIKIVSYWELKTKGKVDLEDDHVICGW